jgi:TrmH family RNA methyltransferase
MEIGKHNRKLAELRKATKLGTLTADGLLPIEGPVLLEEAARSGLEVVDLFLRKGAAAPDVPSGMVYHLASAVFKSIQNTDHSQGVIATVRPHDFTLGDVTRAPVALLIVLARLQDPGNAGTILRVGESLGATGCIALGGTVSFHNSKLVRASAGSVFRLPHIFMSAGETMRALRSRGILVAGTAPSGKTSIEEWDWNRPTAVLIGNEGAGLNSEELAGCDAVLRIPHNPVVESLNSAIAAAIILYEASKRRRQPAPAPR